MDIKPIDRSIGPAYMGYTLGVAQALVTEAFRKRYGRMPDEVFKSGSIWLAGPIPDENNGGASHRPAPLTARVEAASQPMTPERARQLAMEV